MSSASICYHDTTLYESDLKLLEPGQWLNDNCISLFFEYLAHEKHAELSKSVAFLTPAAVLVARFLEESEGEDSDVEDALDGLDLATKDFVFMPVNNNTDMDSPGGSHWSLLVFDRQAGSFLHYDSLSSANDSHARELAERIAPALGDLRAPPKFVSPTCPQQDNGYDCGVYVLAVAAALAELLVREGTLRRAGAALSKVKADRVDELRGWLLQFARRLHM